VGRLTMTKAELLKRIEALEYRVLMLESSRTYLWPPVIPGVTIKSPCPWCGKIDCHEAHVICTNETKGT
jgi:hypothetical protein